MALLLLPRELVALRDGAGRLVLARLDVRVGALVAFCRLWVPRICCFFAVEPRLTPPSEPWLARVEPALRGLAAWLAVALLWRGKAAVCVFGRVALA
jgi:hypothetical protein